jgi:SAM-dependent methyltransferase
VPDLPEHLPLNDECRFLLELHSQPELIAAIENFEGTELKLQSELRKRFPPELVSAALTQTELRQRAASKFSRAADMWFDRQGLEQATQEALSSHKARRFRGDVWDLCCGIGGDTIGLAERCRVTAVDLNPAACLRTWWNADAYGRQNRIEVRCDDVTKLGLGGALVHIDPDRRPGGHRVIRMEDAEPGLPFLKAMMQTARGGAIKLSPASNFIGKFPDAEIELTSVDAECKEATIWFGELAEPGIYRATTLPSGETLSGDPLSALAEHSKVGRYVFDPDPGIVRSGLLDLLAESNKLCRLDEEEEYLTADCLPETSFVRSFEVIDVLPYQEKELRRYFRAADFGQLEIKCRHIKVPIEPLRKKLTLEGSQPGVLIVAREAGHARAIVCRRVD